MKKMLRSWRVPTGSRIPNGTLEPFDIDASVIVKDLLRHVKTPQDAQDFGIDAEQLAVLISRIDPACEWTIKNNECARMTRTVLQPVVMQEDARVVIDSRSRFDDDLLTKLLQDCAKDVFILPNSGGKASVKIIHMPTETVSFSNVCESEEIAFDRALWFLLKHDRVLEHYGRTGASRA